MSIICNTTILSNFATIDQLDLLRQLYGRITIPTAVYEEIQVGIEEGYTFCRDIETAVYPFHADGWIQATNVTGEAEFRALVELPRKIHQGEAACLVIARQRNWLFLTDDRAARKIATAWGIKLSGTLGCLVLAVEKQHCSLAQANRYLAQMIQQGYRSPVNDLTAFL
ncbi:MAG: hypothetical protein KC421_09105 [Anaerolineales bacterium]|nr:hypothetical protein [Anaerolineales bacterium]